MMCIEPVTMPRAKRRQRTQYTVCIKLTEKKKNWHLCPLFKCY